MGLTSFIVFKHFSTQLDRYISEENAGILLDDDYWVFLSTMQWKDRIEFKFRNDLL